MGNTVNLATKYASAVQERFYKDSITQDSFSKDLDMEFTGVRTVKVYEVDTAPLNDYTRSGPNRYGTPRELTDNLQEFIMTQDKAFTYTIDKGNAKEQFNVKQAGTSLKRQMREVVTPYIDKYRMRIWAQGAGTIAGLSAAPTKSTIADAVMDGTVALDDALAPADGRTLYITSKNYKLLKLCDEFISVDKLGEKALAKGVVGEFDGMLVKKVPSSYMPEDVYFMIICKGAAISPVKLNDYKIHSDPPGISGDLVEGRVIFDAFVKGAKAAGIYVAAKAASVAAAPTVSVTGHTATITSATEGAAIKYTTDGSDPRYSATALLYSGTAKPTTSADTVVRACAYKEGMLPSGVGEGVDSGS